MTFLLRTPPLLPSGGGASDPDLAQPEMPFTSKFPESIFSERQENQLERGVGGGEGVEVGLDGWGSVAKKHVVRA